MNTISAWTTSYAAGSRLGWHARRLPYLSVVLTGSYDEHVGGHVMACVPLRLRYHAAHEEHSHVFGTVGARCLNIELTEAWSESLEDLEACASPLMIDAADLRTIAVLLDASDPLERESAVAELLSACEEQLRVHRAAERKTAIRIAIDYIECALAQPIALKDLAQLVGLHPTHFARSFRSATGLTVGQYLRRRRLAKAQHMLTLAGDVGISRIAAATGFADHAHMTRTFRMLIGMAPSEYRRFSRK